MKPAALMLQGTGSDVGKSLLVAGLARAYTRHGLRVRPFKPQNMSNNAAVTTEGGEIGRAQALQARACGAAPSVHMNPVLLKPQTDIGAQVVVQGQVWGNATARDYGALKADLLPRVLESFARLGAEAELILVEGAGSPAEVNLRAGDIANMGFAEAAEVPVALVGDIARGGVIASIVGTWRLLPPEERARLKGVIVNRFRGDVSLFDGGLEVIARETGLACFGVVPHFAEARRLPAEDALAVESYAPPNDDRAIRIAVPVISRIANFDDLDPLMAEPDVAVTFVRAGEAIPGDCDLIVLPGSKATLADLAYLRAQGWDIDIAARLRRGGHVLGLCGGYQMLGTAIRDPQGIEGAPGEAPGLGHLEIETELAGPKTLVEAEGCELASGEAVRGYAAEFSPEVAARADALEGETFTDVLRSAFSIVRESYGSAESKVAAFKTAWTDEFAGHVLDALPDARVIHILRDPRAVCASKNARPDKYPWLFLIRQWRKLAVFTWLAGQNPSWRDRLLMIRYEDLIAQPEDWAEKIAAFLGIDPDPAMADARTFRDTGGHQWGGNSSHFENVYAFNRASADKWKRALEPQEIAYIEHLCLPEMGIFGYEPTVEVTPEIPEALVFDPPRVPEDSLAKWIRPYEIASPEALIREMALESLRYRAIWSASALSDELATLLFLDPAFHRAIKRPAAAQAEA